MQGGSVITAVTGEVTVENRQDWLVPVVCFKMPFVGWFLKVKIQSAIINEAFVATLQATLW
ncbi:hypothetical protein ACFS07_18170 [Undibacterium arcticum]